MEKIFSKFHCSNFKNLVNCHVHKKRNYIHQKTTFSSTVHYSVQIQTGPKINLDRIEPDEFGPVHGSQIFFNLVFSMVHSNPLVRTEDQIKKIWKSAFHLFNFNFLLQIVISPILKNIDFFFQGGNMLKWFILKRM